MNNPVNNDAGNKPSGTAGRFLYDYVYPIVIALLLAVFITQCLVFNARVPTESMVHTIEAGDRFVGWRPAYLLSKPAQGDIIVFRSYEMSGDIYDCTLVKRVIANEGDRICINSGVVYVNDIPMDEPYINGSFDSDMAEIHVPEGCCFVMGDNRSSSYDSRYWLNPFVRYSDIYAKVIWIYYPKPRVPD